MTIFTNPGSPGANSNASGGKVYAFNNIGTAPVPNVAPANPQRTSVTFHNPGSVDIFIAPALVLVNGSSVALVPSTGSLGGCFRVFANGGSLTVTGECQGAWQAFSASAGNNSLTVMDTNV